MIMKINDPEFSVPMDLHFLFLGMKLSLLSNWISYVGNKKHPYLGLMPVGFDLADRGIVGESLVNSFQTKEILEKECLLLMA